MMTLRPFLVIAILAAGSAMAFDPLDPIALNRAAIEALRAGDLRTAEILLARASRLAPGDTRLAKTREALEAKRAGRDVVLDAPLSAPPDAVAKEAPAAPSREPPPLWPPK